jgi:3-oxoacyl-[acyl-carrier protein] reductase
MRRFAGQNVLVTGAAQRIGRGIAEAFLAEGARVFAADIRRMASS